MKKHTIILLLILAASLPGVAQPRVGADIYPYLDAQLSVAVREAESARPPWQEGVPQPFAPRSANNGKLLLVDYTDWTSGFFAGTLWLLFEMGNDPKWERLARHFTDRLDGVQHLTSTHDLGFMTLCSFGNGYRLTHDERYRRIIVQAAGALATRFSPTVGAIRSWGDVRDSSRFLVIIDNMMNLELLFRAAALTGDPHFRHIAVTHANTTIRHHFRDDNTSFHVVNYDPATGTPLWKKTAQGAADSSRWARGQAWGLYGFTICFRETADTAYLAQAVKIARAIIENPTTPADRIPYWDYDDPAIPHAPRDASAAAITASALYELSRYDTAHAPQYLRYADTIIDNLTDSYRAPAGEDFGFILRHSTGSRPEHSEVDVPLCYADYYYMEALLRRAENEKR
jgi:rhamnogalacturonyl hydrolase YesR